MRGKDAITGIISVALYNFCHRCAPADFYKLIVKTKYIYYILTTTILNLNETLKKNPESLTS